jgi:hypothetical protein
LTERPLGHRAILVTHQRPRPLERVS